MSEIARPEVEERSQRQGRASASRGHLACAAMTFAAAGLVAAVVVGAPLVSILLAGLLLLCPLLLWGPFGYQSRSLDTLPLARRGDD